LNFTDVAPKKLLPLIVTNAPTLPDAGLKLDTMGPTIKPPGLTPAPGEKTDKPTGLDNCKMSTTLDGCATTQLLYSNTVKENINSTNRVRSFNAPLNSLKITMVKTLAARERGLIYVKKKYWPLTNVAKGKQQVGTPSIYIRDGVC